MANGPTLKLVPFGSDSPTNAKFILPGYRRRRSVKCHFREWLTPESLIIAVEIGIAIGIVLNPVLLFPL